MNTFIRGIGSLLLVVALSLQYGEVKACGTVEARYCLGCGSTTDIVIWKDSNSSPQAIKGAVIGTDGMMGNPTTISLPGQECSAPQLKLNANGDALAVWVASDSVKSNYTLYASVLPVGGVWSPPVALSNNEEGVSSSSVEVSFNEKGQVSDVDIYFESVSFYESSPGSMASRVELRLVKGNIIHGWNPAKTLLVTRAQ